MEIMKKIFHLLALGLVFSLAACTEQTKEPPSETVPSSFSYVIEVADLRKKMNTSSAYSLIEVSLPTSYAEGHIPTARSTWRPAYSDSTYPYGGMRASREQMETLMGQLGIGSQDTIVVYDEVGSSNALRFWWLLQLYGHEAAVVLNGGKPAWQAEGFPLSQEPPAISPTPYHFPNEKNEALLATQADVRLAITDSQTILLDTRSVEEYTGKLHKKSAARPGCIPTSINLDWAYAIHYGEDFRFKPKDGLRQLFEGKGITPDRKIIVYCHSGVRSSHTTFVLRELLGYPHVQNYDGSWIEWSQE